MHTGSMAQVYKQHLAAATGGKARALHTQTDKMDKIKESKSA